MVCGSVNAHFDELLGLMKKDYLDEICQVTAKLQKFNMTIEEVTLLRAIISTSGGKLGLFLLISCKECLNIPKMQSETVYRRTENTMAEINRANIYID